eukprot:7379687-Prymnesium_polylepis.1
MDSSRPRPSCDREPARVVSSPSADADDLTTSERFVPSASPFHLLVPGRESLRRGAGLPQLSDLQVDDAPIVGIGATAAAAAASFSDCTRAWTFSAAAFIQPRLVGDLLGRVETRQAKLAQGVRGAG